MASVDNVGGVDKAVNPVTRPLNAVLKADNGRLCTAETPRLVNAAKKAVAHRKAGARTQAKDAVSDAVAALPTPTRSAPVFSGHLFRAHMRTRRPRRTSPPGVSAPARNR